MNTPTLTERERNLVKNFHEFVRNDADYKNIDPKTVNRKSWTFENDALLQQFLNQKGEAAFK